MSNPNSLVPLSDIGNQNAEILNWRLNLPEYVPTDGIAINIGVTELVARLGALSSFTVRGYDGDRSEIMPIIPNVDSRGNAIVSIVTSKQKAESFKATVEEGNRPSSLYSEYWRDDATVEVNVPEITDKVLRTDQDNSLRSAELWSKELNKSLKAGLSRSVNEQILRNVSRRSRQFFFVTAIAEAEVPFQITSSVQIDAPEILAITCFSQMLISILAGLDGASLRERRLSLIPCYQVDRLFIAQSILKTHRLIKPIRSSTD